MKRLLYPRHVAFIGGLGLGAWVRQCEEIGFEGEIWVVNPKHPEMAGRRCYASVDDLPGAPDAAFIAVRREITIPVVRALAARGAGGCICFAAGFAEAGGEGEELERELTAAAGEMALVGPNCYGILNYLDGVILFPPPHGGERVERGVAIVSQSGNISLNVTMSERSVPIAFVISAGNQAVLGLGDYVAALIEDPRIAAIGLYIEGLKDVAGFSAAAARAMSKGIPIVAVKSGTSRVGAQMTFSHTSSRAGSDVLYQALFERLGMIRVGSLAAMLETLKLLAISGPLTGRRLGVLTASGGEAALVADLAARAGLTLAQLSQGQVAAFSAQLAPFAAVSNPLDYNTPLWGDAQGLERCFTTMADGDTDATLLILDYPRPRCEGREEWDTALDAFIAVHMRSGKQAMVLSTIPELMPADVRDRLIVNGIAPLQGLDEVEAALGGAAWYGDRRRHIGAGGGTENLRLPPVPPAPEAPRVLDEGESKRKLAAFGLRVPEGRMITGAVAELSVRVERDDQFGLALVVATGGVPTGRLGVSRTVLLPAERQAITEALESLERRGDQEAAIDAVLAIAAFAERHREHLLELSVDRLAVLAPGEGALAVDASITMGED